MDEDMKEDYLEYKRLKDLGVLDKLMESKKEELESLGYLDSNGKLLEKVVTEIYHDELERYVGCKGLESLSSSQTSILHLSASRTRLALALLEATADSNSIPVKRYFFMLVYISIKCASTVASSAQNTFGNTQLHTFIDCFTLVFYRFNLDTRKPASLKRFSH